MVGTARRLADASGTVTDGYSFDAFGRWLGGWGSTENPYDYGAAWGYLRDYSGMQQLGARFYWPEIGRFIQQDPIGDGMNWYTYAGNSPVTGADPSGLHDIAAGVEGELFVGGGWEGGAGVVVDVDSWSSLLDSGIYWTHSTDAGLGYNAGIGLGVVIARELEGEQANIDLNLGDVSATGSWVYPGQFNALGFAWGPGFGFDLSVTETHSFTVRDLIAIGNKAWGRARGIWPFWRAPGSPLSPAGMPQRSPNGGGARRGRGTSGSPGTQGEGGPGSSVSPGYWNPGQGHGPKGGQNGC